MCKLARDGIPWGWSGSLPGSAVVLLSSLSLSLAADQDDRCRILWDCRGDVGKADRGSREVTPQRDAQERVGEVACSGIPSLSGFGNKSRKRALIPCHCRALTSTFLGSSATVLLTFPLELWPPGCPGHPLPSSCACVRMLWGLQGSHQLLSHV